MSDLFNHEADAWESLRFDDDDDGEEVMEWYWPHPARKTCNRCGLSGLSWLLTKEGWRLSNDLEIHHCAAPS